MNLDDALKSSRRSTKLREGEVVASLRALGDSIGGNQVVEEILENEKLRSTLSSLSKADGLEAVKELGESLQNRLPELDPIEDHGKYFLKILSRYSPSHKSAPQIKKEGEVVASIRHLGRKNKKVGNNMVKEMLANEEVRTLLSSLTKSQGLEAVETLGHSMSNRSKDLKPISDPARYFMKILNRYASLKRSNNIFINPYHNHGNRKRQRPDDHDNRYERGPLRSKRRLSKSRVDRNKTNNCKLERIVTKLESKLQGLTSELKKAKRELAEQKS